MERNSLILPSVILGAAFLITGVVGSLAILKIRSFNDTIAVTGSAEVRMTSDTAKWTLQIVHSTDINALASGYSSVEKDRKALRAFLKEQGIEDAWITEQPIAVDTMYDYNRGGAPSGYTLRQMVLVETDAIPTLKKAVEASGELIGKGAVVSTLSLEYFLSDLQSRKQEILAAAMEDAYARAEKMVASAGGKLGTLRSASMGVLQVTAVNSVEVSDYGMYDTSALEKKVTAVVRASFGIQ